jgi:hypothetical protein
MVLGIIGAVAGAVAIPMGAVALPNAATATATSTVGVSQGSMQGNQKGGGGGSGGGGGGGGGPDPNDPRLVKFTLKTHCEQGSAKKKNILDRRQVVLRQGKVLPDTLFEVSYMS